LITEHAIRTVFQSGVRFYPSTGPSRRQVRRFAPGDGGPHFVRAKMTRQVVQFGMSRFSAVLCSSLVASALWGQAPLGESLSNAGSVEGMVIQSQSSDPIKKAEVSLNDVGGAPGTRLAITDSAGRFKLADVSPGSYRVVVTRTGFVHPRARKEDASREPALVTVLPKQEITGLVYRLAPASILAGRVLDEDDAPLPDARIEVFKSSYGRNGQRMVSAGFATTDDRGQYRLAGLDPGRYYLQVTFTDPSSLLGGPRSGPIEGYSSLFYPGVTDAGQAAAVALGEGEERPGVDFKLTPAHIVHIQGQVRYPDGRLAGKEIVVNLVPRLGAGFGGRGGVSVGGDGGFRFDGVTAGSYILSAYPAQGRTTNVRQLLEVGETDLDGLRVTLKSATDLRGRIRFEGDRQVRLAGLRVFLSPTDETMLLTRDSGRATIEADGSFVFHSVADGQYAIEIGNLPEDCFLKAVNLGDRPVAAGELNINESSAASALELVVSAAGGRVDGSLTDEKQRPAANVTVVLVPDATQRKNTELYRSVTADQNGRFSIRGVPPGDYKLLAWKEELELWSWLDPSILAPYESQGKSVSIAASSRNAVELQTIGNSR
jgi:hypothetical protein